MSNILQFPTRSYEPELVQSLIGESDKRVMALLRAKHLTNREIVEAQNEAAELVRNEHIAPGRAAACAVVRAMARHDSGMHRHAD